MDYWKDEFRDRLAAGGQFVVRYDHRDPVRAGLSEITAPTLVLHGTEDPLFPYGHGEALAQRDRRCPADSAARVVPHQVPCERSGTSSS